MGRKLKLSIFCAALSLTCTAAIAQDPTQFKHVVVVALENHSYEQTIGNSAMPFFNGLASTYGLANNFYSTEHPSFGNYLRLVTGESITAEDNFDARVSVPNIVRELGARGETWKVYSESLPSVGYLGVDVYPYVRHHNPFVYLTDVIDNPTQQLNVVPFSQFAADLSATALPNFSFVIPNVNDDGHDCPAGMATCSDNDKLAAADQWLQVNIGPLLSDPTFQSDGLLIIWFDEGDETDSTNGGGHIALILAGNGIKPGYKSTTFYRDEHLLRTFADIFGFASLPGSAQYVTSMAEFFQPFPVSAPPAQVGSIAGQVVNASTGRSIAGAVVVNGALSVTADATGHFAFSSLNAGTYTLVASASGYLKRSVQASVTAGSTTNLTEAIATAGKTKGLITNASGTVILGAQVQFVGGVVPTTVTITSSIIGYSTNWIPAGSYTVTVSAPGYSTVVTTNTVTTGVIGTLNLTLQ